jgi:hypothetical protein
MGGAKRDAGGASKRQKAKQKRGLTAGAMQKPQGEPHAPTVAQRRTPRGAAAAIEAAKGTSKYKKFLAVCASIAVLYHRPGVGIRVLACEWPGGILDGLTVQYCESIQAVGFLVYFPDATG